MSCKKSVMNIRLYDFERLRPFYLEERFGFLEVDDGLPVRIMLIEWLTCGCKFRRELLDMLQPDLISMSCLISCSRFSRRMSIFAEGEETSWGRVKFVSASFLDTSLTCGLCVQIYLWFCSYWNFSSLSLLSLRIYHVCCSLKKVAGPFENGLARPLTFC